MMARGWKTLWLLTRRTVGKYGADNSSILAAAISYYILFSIVPLVIFLTAVFGFIVRDPDVEREVIDRIVAAAPLEQGEGETFVSDTLNGVSRVSTALGIAGLLALAWSASAMFGAVRRALNITWGASSPRPIVQQKLLDLAMVAGFGAFIATSIASTTALRILQETSHDVIGPLTGDQTLFWSTTSLAVPALLTFGVFLLVYRYVPSVSPSFSEVLPGALLATLLFEALKNGFAFYVARFNNYDIIYGSLGALMLFLLWTYLSATILLFSAALSYEYARLRRGEYAEALAPGGAGTPLRDRVGRFLRGLFVHQREEPGPDLKAKS
ncbi:MAG: YihY/virulence factor BrkB family protein [Dehalococcoidia bacterium]